jgi:hypothetical protein
LVSFSYSTAYTSQWFSYVYGTRRHGEAHLQNLSFSISDALLSTLDDYFIGLQVLSGFISGPNVTIGLFIGGASAVSGESDLDAVLFFETNDVFAAL